MEVGGLGLGGRVFGPIVLVERRFVRLGSATPS